MSVIIYGERAYGTVEAHGGEYAQTRFFHIWFVPLIPLGSHWMTRRDAGYTIGMHGKSVLAGYGRVWGPAIALGTFVAGLGGNPIMLLVSALAIAATVWTWTWRTLRGEAALRRSDFNYVAFGTRCEPDRMSDELRTAFKRSLDARWNELKPDRSPNEIARHGTKNAHEAVVAYGLLRLAGAMRGRAGREEDSDADRILDGAHSALAVGEGPYREGVQSTPTGSLATVVTQLAAAQHAVEADAPAARAEELARQKRRSRKQLLGLVLATPVALAGIGMFVQAVRPTREVVLADLRAMHPPTGRTVKVTCDSIEPPLWEEVDSHGDATHRIAMCALGKYFLPLRLDADEAVPTSVVVGKLRDVNDRLIWVREGLQREPVLEARSLEVYVDSSDPHEDIFLGIFGLGIALGVPVLWVLWFRARRRRKAAVAAL